MKNIKYILSLLLLVAVATSCSDDFFDRQPTDVLTTQEFKKASKVNPKLAGSLVPGIYSLTFEYGVGGWGSHTDFGHKSLDMASDIMSGDMVLTSKKYNKFVGVYELTGMDRTDGRPYMTWRYFYKVIKAANDILVGFDDMPEDDLGKSVYGQALALRAYAYFYLVNYFQQPYLESMDKPSVCLYTEPANEGAALSTVKEVYDVVLKDLETAVVALENFSRAAGDISTMNKYVAEGWLVYAYLYTGQYAKAEAAAKDIIENGGFTLMSKEEVLKSGFNSVKIPGWMWGIDLTKANSPKLPTFWGMADIFTYSYASVANGFVIDQGLYQAIPDTDVRKEQFKPVFSSQPDQFYPINKFFDAAREYQGDRTWTNDEVYMRVAEFYLAMAEAQARQGKDDEAKATLLQLVNERDTNASARINPLSGQSLLDEIYFQWRVEMWGEGRSLFAAKRFKKTLTRGSNHIDLAGESYEYNDPRMIFEIPEAELNNNPNIKL